MTTPGARIQQAADALYQAGRTGRPTAPVRSLLPTGDVDAAYEVQARNIERALADGQRRIGCKIGLTSVAVQRQLGVDQPDFGVLLSGMRYPDGAILGPGVVAQPRIEAEVALILGADLDLPDPTEADLRAVVAEVRPALEIVGSRIAGWDIQLVDTVADNASAGAFVIGEAGRPLGDLDLTAVSMTMRRGGVGRPAEVVSEGTGADCLGSPLAAARWLARTRHRYGQPLRGGEVVLTGALGPVVPVAAGDSFEAELTGLGTVRASFG